MMENAAIELYEGLIVRATGGFYYVRDAKHTVACRARGIFRKEKMTPLVGDRVRFSVQDEQAGEGTVEEILPRRNALVRPPLANLDRLFIVSAAASPQSDTFAIDKLSALAETAGIEPAFIFTKCDLAPVDELADIYRKAGFAAFVVSSMTGQGVTAVRDALQGVCAFTGNSGVGKSSLLNRIAPALSLQVGDVSRRLGRGRHTTRTVELFRMADYGISQEGYMADTPGFSALDVAGAVLIRKEQLPFAFREFAPYLDGCRYRGCAHVREDGCAVRAAVERGEIAASRHASYCAMYEAVKDIKDWELKK
ncbi:ribosome small subunit-dependent GTPase A [Ethanoligenens harbinense]|uniref:Small ribosomal subunit biogenesis GTPase RsgA n=1 Tax=Ethanoligenens harbinense (strain DSM 18485 / JCM 12961 / CGMCC 1.5033 / YUAN-3) TaxID=663278 RepID=E6U3M6_ETHHY|nr:ribosome small subunit-dependent GTPase A [Ethanoligenens harbinense]ADU27626.1 ribosome small subunit-dependent GTPase A [Ethanoligenens harbinense YUAN-3]